jgi:ribosome-associated protein
VQPLAIGHHATLNPDELAFEFTRSGGPGGQNVNKVNTRATVRLDLAACTAFTPEQTARIRRRLATRISRDGVLRVVASRHRTQGANRDAAVSRLVELLTAALDRPKPRRKTRVPASVKRHRREDKTRRSQQKRDRAWRSQE